MDNPVFIHEDRQSGYTSSGGDRRKSSASSGRRMSQYYITPPSSHHSSSASASSSYHNLIPPSHHLGSSQFFHPSYYPQHAAEYPPAAFPPSTMWQFGGRYKEDELPNHASNMAAALFPRVHANNASSHYLPLPNRRFSVASIAPIPGPSGNPYGVPPSMGMAHAGPPQQSQQRRKISVTKYQDIPPTNYLQVPTFHDYSVQQSSSQSPPTLDYVDYDTRDTKVRTKESSRRRRRSESILPQLPLPEDPSLSTASSNVSPTDSQPTETRKAKDTSPAAPAPETPDPTAVPVPAFEFTSSHLPLRPPTINVHKYSSGGSGSTSTPESQRVESRQMIRSDKLLHAPKVDQVQRSDSKNESGSRCGDRKKGNSIFTISRPAKWCAHHGQEKTCKECSLKMETASQCSSVNPPPTFTAMDNYQPVKRRNKCSCSCGVIFRVSIILAVIVMLFIAAFILYVELQLRHHPASAMDMM